MFKAGLKEGDDLRTVDLTEVLDKLWATGSFDDIKFEVADEQGGKKLIIRVKERPLIKEVDYRGGTELGLSAVKDKIKEKKLDHQPRYGLRSGGDPQGQGPPGGPGGREGLPQPGHRRDPGAHGAHHVPPGVRHQGGRQGPDLQDHLPGQQGHLQPAAAQGHGQDPHATGCSAGSASHDLLVQKNLDDDLENIKKAYWKLGLQGRLRGQAHHRRGGPHHRQAEEEEREAHPGQVPQVRSPGHPHHPDPRRGPVHGGHPQDRGQRQGVQGAQGRRVLPHARSPRSSGTTGSWLARWFNIKPDHQRPRRTRAAPSTWTPSTRASTRSRKPTATRATSCSGPKRSWRSGRRTASRRWTSTLKVDEGEQYTVRHLNFEGNTKTKDKVLRRSMILKEGRRLQDRAVQGLLHGLWASWASST